MKPKGILIVLGIIFGVFALTTCFLIFKIQKVHEIQKAKIPEQKETVEMPPGKHVYEIITDKPRDPQIIEVEIDPLEIKVGESQIVRAKVKTMTDSVRAEDFVLGKAICDDKEFEFPFKLKKIEGKEELITTWEGKWERGQECTFEKNHQIKILAKNIKGEDSVTLSLGSSCPTPRDGQNYVLSTTTVGSDGCIFPWNINGVENGNIIVESGFTLTIGGIAGGQTIVFNPGYSIIINGSIALNKTSGYQGQIKKGYLCAKNSDGDSYYAYGVDSSNTCGNFGGSRRYTLTSLTAHDCDDSNANIYQNVANLSKDQDQDGYTASSPATQCVGSSTTTAGRTYYKDSSGNYSWLLDSQKLGSNDCNDSNNLVWTYGYGIDNDGDNYGQSSYGCNNGAPPRTATAGTDCDDSNANIYQYVDNLSKDQDQDGYTPMFEEGEPATRCVGSSTTTAGRTYYKDSSGNYSWLLDSQKLGIGDCCDIDAGTYPDAPDFHASPNACDSWDWNCDWWEEPGSGCITYHPRCTEDLLDCWTLYCTYRQTISTGCTIPAYTVNCGPYSVIDYECSYGDTVKCYSGEYCITPKSYTEKLCTLRGTLSGTCYCR